MSEIKTPGLEDNLSYRGAPYQQLITDKDGNAQWEDRLAYSESTDVTIMEEQTVEFNEDGYAREVLEIKERNKLTVTWDGISYDCVVKINGEGNLYFGNLSLEFVTAEETGEPFLYVYEEVAENYYWFSSASESHTIKVTLHKVTYIPMDINFLPKNFNIVFTQKGMDLSSISCNFTYNQIREWIENDLPIVAIFRHCSDGRKELITRWDASDRYIEFTYQNMGDSSTFAYFSDGTFGELGAPS